MKSRLYCVAALVLMLGALATAAGAQDDTPAESPEDNACYADGSLEGKCDWPTDAEDAWAWTCGWYIARYEIGEFAYSQIPVWCNYFIGVADGGDDGEDPVRECYDSVLPQFNDFELTEPLNTLENALGYSSTDGSCSGDVLQVRETIVTADGYSEALETCGVVTNNDFAQVIHLATGFGYNTPDNWWACARNSREG
jgi:hypothetical protein